MLRIDDNLLIVRHLGGLKLIDNKKNYSKNRVAHLHMRVNSVADIMAMPFNVYIQDTYNRIVSINDACVSTFGLESKNSALGTMLENVYRHKSYLQETLDNNKIVINSKEFAFFNERFRLPDQTDINNFTLKFPLFNSLENISGIVVFGINSTNTTDSQFSENMTNLVKSFTAIFHGHMSSHSPLYVIPNLFTTREFEVIHWVVRGKTMREIAGIMKLSIRTVESYFDKIKKKVGVNTKSQFIAMAIN